MDEEFFKKELKSFGIQQVDMVGSFHTQIQGLD